MHPRHALAAILLLPLLAGCVGPDVGGDEDLPARVTEVWVVQDGSGFLVHNDTLLNASLEVLSQLAEAHGPLTPDQEQRLRTNTSHVRLLFQPGTELGLDVMPHAGTVTIDRAHLVFDGADAVGANVVLGENGTLGAWTTRANLTEFGELALEVMAGSAALAAREAAQQASQPAEHISNPDDGSCEVFHHRLRWTQEGVFEAVEDLDASEDAIHRETPGPSLVPELPGLVPSGWNGSIGDVRWQPTLEDDGRRTWEPLLLKPENGSLGIEGRFEEHRDHSQVAAWFTAFASNVTDGDEEMIDRWSEAFLASATWGPSHPRQGHQGPVPNQTWFSVTVEANATLSRLVDAHSFERAFETFGSASFEAGAWQILVSVPFTFLYGDQSVLMTGSHGSIQYELETHERLDRPGLEERTRERFESLGLPAPDVSEARLAHLNEC